MPETGNPFSPAMGNAGSTQARFPDADQGRTNNEHERQQQTGYQAGGPQLWNGSLGQEAIDNQVDSN